MPTNASFIWGGSQVFRLNRNAVHEDTLRIKSNYAKSEKILTLMLPTLCITYADMKFQNQVGGEQESFPQSQAYGPLYFDPPVTITGEKEIERLTYIRGAQRVVISPHETRVEFPSWKELVIPRLRLDRQKVAEARLEVPNTLIKLREPLMIDLRQFADGRHIGGIRIEKRHPKWPGPVAEPIYDLWIRMLDGPTLKPLPKVPLDILRWDPKWPTPYGQGAFRFLEQRISNGKGDVRALARPSGELEAFAVRKPGCRAVVRCVRPLSGQKINLHMRVWPLSPDLLPYVWRKGDTLENIAELSGHPVQTILELNQLNSASQIKTGMRIVLPCYAAIYRMEPWDNFDSVARAFGYRNAAGLSKANGLPSDKALDSGADIRLPDWHYFYARENDTLERLDAMFGLPKGCSTTVGRTFHADQRLPYPGEVVAVPMPRFAQDLPAGRHR